PKGATCASAFLPAPGCGTDPCSPPTGCRGLPRRGVGRSASSLQPDDERAGVPDLEPDRAASLPAGAALAEPGMDHGGGDVNAQADARQAALALHPGGDARRERQAEPFDGPAKDESPWVEVEAAGAVNGPRVPPDERIDAEPFARRDNHDLCSS